MADNYIEHPLISYIVVPGCGLWVNKATKIGSDQGFCATKRDKRICGGDQTTPKRWMAGKSHDNRGTRRVQGGGGMTSTTISNVK